jgi:predicted transcriptional regulator
MKRHLGGRGLTPDAYRSKWGLPHDYPMVAPNYAKKRSEMAKSFGLGQMRRKPAEPSPAEQTPPKSPSRNS